MLKKLETKPEVKQWVSEVQTAFSLKHEDCEFTVGTGKYSDGTTGYALEVRHAGGAVAVTPISKYLFDMFRREPLEVFEA